MENHLFVLPLQDSSNVLWALAKLCPSYAAAPDSSLPQTDLQHHSRMDSMAGAVARRLVEAAVDNPQVCVFSFLRF